MSERECIFAWTPPSSDYPPYLNITREPDGRVVVTVRGPKLKPGEAGNENPHDMPGHTVSMELPQEQVWELESHLRGAYVRDRVKWENSFDWGALQELRKASA